MMSLLSPQMSLLRQLSDDCSEEKRSPPRGALIGFDPLERQGDAIDVGALAGPDEFCTAVRAAGRLRGHRLLRLRNHGAAGTSRSRASSIQMDGLIREADLS
jgi:hypothetical protein